MSSSYYPNNNLRDPPSNIFYKTHIYKVIFPPWTTYDPYVNAHGECNTLARVGLLFAYVFTSSSLQEYDNLFLWSLTGGGFIVTYFPLRYQPFNLGSASSTSLNTTVLILMSFNIILSKIVPCLYFYKHK